MENQQNIPMDMIELYVLGQLSAAQRREVEALAASDSKVKAALNELELAMEHMVSSRAIAPPEHIKGTLLDAISRKERSNDPPIIHMGSVASDYATWLNKPEMVRPADAGDIYFIPIAENEDGQSAIVWLTEGSPEETHTDSIEKFLILEGSCEVIFNDHVHELRPGSVLSIPLHTPHTVKVTSAIPCKIMLQRIAA
jgi:mannose-6-phosphate isomerase-like protein (cupin superfamily)